MSDAAFQAQLRHAAATVHGRYLVRPPYKGGASHWFVGFHGQAQTAAMFLPGLLAADPHGEWLVASVQALHPFYRRDEVVAGWMTREDREYAIVDNTGYVATVLDQLATEYGAPRTIVLAGFSQGVAMAYRAALNGTRPIHTLITVGGDTPPELRQGGSQPWPRVLMLTGDADPWYTPELLAADAAAVGAAGAEVRTTVFAGAHEWNEAVVATVAEHLRAIVAG